jgi:hypothetical protein
VFGLSIARDMIDAEHRYDGYSPHPTLIAQPLSFGDLLEAQALPVEGGVPEQRRGAAAR